MKNALVALSLLILTCNAVQADDASGVTVKILAKTGLSWDGTPLPAYPKQAPEITIAQVTLLPGTTLPLHQHQVINAGMVLSGELTVITKDEQTLHLKAGDPIVEVVNKHHYGTNTGSEPAVLVIVYAGVKDMPISTKD